MASRLRTVGSEAPWLEYLERVGVAAAREELLRRGLTSAVAAGVAFWLKDRSEGLELVDRSTRKRYRAALEDLGKPPSPQRPARGRRVRAIPGSRKTAPDLRRAA